MADQEKLPVYVSEHISDNYNWDIVVAFDIGTSYSGYAYSDRKQIKENKINLNEWIGNFSHDKTAKAPSIVLLNEDRSFNSFGYEAEANYAKMVHYKTHHKCYRFRNFKMSLYHEKSISETFEIQEDGGKRKIPATDIFAHTIRVLKGHFQNTIERRGSVYKSKNVLYVLTVPAIWSESAKQFMKKAAIKADLAEHQILLALEPEAAALYCRELQDHMVTLAFEPGTKYMVLDMGGGTIDIVVHKIMEDKTLAEVYKASGGDWGGTIVDAEFKAFVTGLFKNEQCIDMLWEIAPGDALDFEREFEAKKRQISCNTSLDDIRLQIPNRLKQFPNTEIQNQGKSMTLEHIYVDQTQFQGFFKTAKDKIIHIIEKIIDEVGAIELILLVGGFSCSTFLREEITKYFAFSNIRIISPPERSTVVLKGAVIFGYNPCAVSARICRYTYGIGILEPFDSKKHPQRKRTIIDGKEMCKNVFHVLAYKDEIVKYKVEKTFKSISRHRNKNRKFVSITIELYQAKNVREDQLAFVTDEGFMFIGQIVCMPPENGWPDRVDLITKIYFGQTSIRIENYDTANKEQIKASFELD